jgi:adenylosuccinate synthase
VRSFAHLPGNAQRYVAAMMRSILDVAYGPNARPNDARLPNLRYLGVGPNPSQIIKDVPASADLIALR